MYEEDEPWNSIEFGHHVKPNKKAIGVEIEPPTNNIMIVSTLFAHEYVKLNPSSAHMVRSPSTDIEDQVRDDDGKMIAIDKLVRWK